MKTTYKILPHYKEVIIRFLNGMKPNGTTPTLYARLKSIRIINGKNTDLKIDKPVYDIEFELIKESEVEND